MSFSAFSHFWNVTKFVDLSVDIQEVRQVADVEATDCNVFTGPRLGISVQSPTWRKFPLGAQSERIITPTPPRSQDCLL